MSTFVKTPGLKPGESGSIRNINKLVTPPVTQVTDETAKTAAKIIDLDLSRPVPQEFWDRRDPSV